MKNSLKSLDSSSVRQEIKILAAYDYANQLLKVHIIDANEKQAMQLDSIETFERESKSIGLAICQMILEKIGGKI